MEPLAYHSLVRRAKIRADDDDDYSCQESRKLRLQFAREAYQLLILCYPTTAHLSASRDTQAKSSSKSLQRNRNASHFLPKEIEPTSLALWFISRTAERDIGGWWDFVDGKDMRRH
jgi:hypothetical protein